MLPTKPQRRAENKSRRNIVELAEALAHRYIFNHSILRGPVILPPNLAFYIMAESILLLNKTCYEGNTWEWFKEMGMDMGEEG